VAEKNRAQLKGTFQTGNVLTQQDFADLIDSAWNLVDDGSAGAFGATGPAGPTGAQGTSGPTGNNSLSSINLQTGDYTLQLSDKGGMVEIATGATASVTVPADLSVSFPVGSQVLLVRGESGPVSVTGATGVTLRSAQGYLNLSHQYSIAELYKTDTDTWTISGDLSS
jgi:hypothetical protein